MAAGYIYKDGKFDPVGAMDIPQVMDQLDNLESAATTAQTTADSALAEIAAHEARIKANETAVAANSIAIQDLSDNVGDTTTGIVARVETLEAADVAQDEAIAAAQATADAAMPGTLGTATSPTLRWQLSNNILVELRRAGESSAYGVSFVVRDALGSVLYNPIIEEHGSLNVPPVGSVIANASNYAAAPKGYLLCTGAAVSRTTYAALFTKIGTLYGEGDGSTTFNLPDLTNRFIMGHGTAGTVKTAGLPEISGTTPLLPTRWGDTNPDDHQNGCITYSDTAKNIMFLTGSNLYSTKIRINASNSNAIYGNSTTVQPPALTMRYFIKY